MTKTEREKLVRKISTEICALKKSVAVMENSASLITPEGHGGRFSLRDMIKMKSTDERQLRDARGRLNRLERALNKIGDPEFGICFICEQPIPMVRLLAVPETTRCVRCEDR